MTSRWAELVAPTLIVVAAVPWMVPALAYEGFGAGSPGGTGQPVYHVTNLNDAGPGSLRDAVSQSNRHVVFDMGGTINIGNILVSGLSFITIDGASAPSPGITLQGGGGLLFQYGAHDIIVNNIRCRNSSDDCFAVYDAHDIVFDHISAANSYDGSLDITEGSYNVTVQNSIFSKDPYATNAGNMIVAYGAHSVSIHHNIFTHLSRNPHVDARPGPDTGAPAPTTIVADIRNNVVWNWGFDNGSQYGDGTAVDWNAKANIVNNFYQTTGSYPNNLPGLAINLNHNGGGAQVYIAGSVSGNGVDLDAYGNVAIPFPASTVTTSPTCIAAAQVLEQAGARPLDSVDQAIVSGISLANCPVTEDTQAPTVSVTRPTNGATVSGSVTISASAADNVAVAGVQFQVDGVNLGAEDISAPYDLTWNTTLVANGPHTLTAVARDAAGFTAASSAVTVTVSNTGWWPETMFGIKTVYLIIGLAAATVVIYALSRLHSKWRR